MRARLFVFATALAVPRIGVAADAATGPNTARSRADRGFYPNATYSVSGLDAVNPVNGNLVFRMPLASLPPGPGGQSAGVQLTYNSMLYDTSQAFENVVIGNTNYPNTLVTNLRRSTQGGWRYTFHATSATQFDGYGLVLEDRTTPGASFSCGSGSPASAWRRTKLYFQTPDGAMHVLRRSGYPDFGGDGFYAWTPDNQSNVCLQYSTLAFEKQQPAANQDPWYFTTDGSYIGVKISSASCIVGTPATSWADRVWIAYMPDGSQVSGCSNRTQEVLDRNGNWTRVYKGTSLSGAPILTLEDQAGRTIDIEFGFSQGVRTTDTIRHRTTGGATLTWTVDWQPITVGNLSYRCAEIGPTLYKDCTFTSGSMDMVTRITSLRDVHEFQYDTSPGGWGELNRVVLPIVHGSVNPTLEYEYAKKGQYRPLDELTENPVSKKTLKHCALKADGNPDGCVPEGAMESWQWIYSIGPTMSTITAPDGGITRYHYHDRRLQSNRKRGLVYKVEEPHGKVTERIWAHNLPPDHESITYDPGNPYIKTEFMTVGNASNLPVKTSARNFEIDKNGNTLSVNEHDWQTYAASATERAAGPTGLIRRRTENKYFVNAPAADLPPSWTDTTAYWHPDSNRLRFRLKSSTITNGSTTKAYTEYSYDGNGNRTQERRWSDIKASTIPSQELTVAEAVITSWVFDGQGNLTRVVLPSGSYTAYEYEAISGCGSASPVAGLYPTKRNESGVRSFSLEWDCLGGVMKTETDMDNTVSSSWTYDQYGRVHTQNLAGLQGETNLYDDTKRTVYSAADALTAGDRVNVTITHLDDIGRTLLVRRTDETTPTVSDPVTALGGTKVRTVYGPPAATGTLEAVTNAYRAPNAAGVPASEKGMGWTRTTRDQLGRVRAVSQFSGALPSNWTAVAADAASPTTTTAFDADKVEVVDPDGRKKVFSYDGLGRLISVVEDPQPPTPPATPPPTPPLNYETLYGYDVFDNVISVTQGGQERTFVYDSLSRLTSAQNPETGLISYTYYDGGQMKTKTDARGATVTYTYGTLDRLTGKTYTGTPGVGKTAADATPAVVYTYDNCGPLSKGRLCSVAAGAATTEFLLHDALGRVLRHRQTVGAKQFEFNYGYTASGGLKHMQYPARGSNQTVVTYEFDSRGRLAFVRRGGPASAERFVKENVKYWADGTVEEMQFGNTTTERTEINGLGQMASRQLLLGGGTNAVKLEFDYTKGGNLNWQRRTQGASAPIQTNYPEYDGVSRLKTASEGWTQTYSYDRWGNMWTSGGPGTLHSATPKDSGYYNTSNNRLARHGTGGGTALPTNAHDAAGNLVNHPDLGVFQYDAEGRIYQASAGSPAIAATYEYDGNGRRVRKTVTGGGSTVFVYDAFGQLALDEGPGTATPETVYLTADHLGSTRYRRGATASGEKCYDYLPFGVAVPTSARPQDPCFTADGAPAVAVGGEWMRVRFTGHWRDWETELDYFGARYYSRDAGRFMSPDEPFVDQDVEDPQSWHLFSYASNNPLYYVDPSGNCKKPAPDSGLRSDKDGGEPCPMPGTVVTVTAPMPEPVKAKDQVIAAGVGHHGLSEWKKLLTPGTPSHDFFSRWYTGDLPVRSANYFDHLHRQYNAAVRGVVAAYFAARPGLTFARMSKPQMKELARAILRATANQPFMARLELLNPGKLQVLRAFIANYRFTPGIFLLPEQVAMLNFRSCGAATCGGGELY